ncbi:MAG: bifunctional riboflavin kinase/FAD synthetase [Alphaproteobacteria bacterium]
MNYFETYKDLPDYARDCVVVIGNFDGVHLGHQALLERACLIAKEKGKKVAALTFEPHPRQLFRADEPFRRITPAPLKKERLLHYGADIIFSLPFDWDFASQPPEQFAQDILINALAASHVVIGHDFRFGQLRQGKAQTIKDAGIPVNVVDEIIGHGDIEEISSSCIRQLLQDGKIEQANTLLGWAWEIRSKIIKGDQRGRQLGYPTANMELGETIHPAYGVYACCARLSNETHWRDGVANIGIRPMFEVKTALVETYIFDFNQEIYGRTVCVQPVKRLRGEAKFDSLDTLIAQIEKDCAQAKEILMSSKNQDTNFKGE